MALVEITTLLVAVAANAIVFRRLDGLAGVLFIPYVLWVGYASILILSLWLLN